MQKRVVINDTGEDSKLLRIFLSNIKSVMGEQKLQKFKDELKPSWFQWAYQFPKDRQAELERWLNINNVPYEYCERQLPPQTSKTKKRKRESAKPAEKKETKRTKTRKNSLKIKETPEFVKIHISNAKSVMNEQLIERFKKTFEPSFFSWAWHVPKEKRSELVTFLNKNDVKYKFETPPQLPPPIVDAEPEKSIEKAIIIDDVDFALHPLYIRLG